MRNEVIPQLTGMRGWAAWFVLTYHVVSLPAFYGWYHGHFPTVLGLSMAVDFFFVLSGYLLTKSYLSGGPHRDLKKYYLKRILRIWPLYFVSLVTVLLLQAMIFHKSYTWFQIVATVTFTQNWFQSSYEVINGVYWTLAIEEIFYLLLPLLVVLVFRNNKIDRYSVLCLGLVGFLWRYLAYVEGSWLISSQFLGFIFCFLFGMMVTQSKMRYSHVRFVLVLIGLFAATSLYGFVDTIYLLPVFNPISSGLFALLIGLCLPTANSSSSILKLFSNKIASLFGRMSYSTYIWHDALLSYVILLSAFIGSFWIPAYIVLIVCVSYLSWRFIEEPCNRLRKRYEAKYSKVLAI